MDALDPKPDPPKLDPTRFVSAPSDHGTDRTDTRSFDPVGELIAYARSFEPEICEIAPVFAYARSFDPGFDARACTCTCSFDPLILIDTSFEPLFEFDIDTPARSFDPPHADTLGECAFGT